MSQLSSTQDPNYLKNEQYKDSRNLGARANLHGLYSSAKMPWHVWVFDHLGLQPAMSVLECGCGPGWLWRSNVERIPTDCHITLTDLSEGMIAEAKQALANTTAEFKFETADIQKLPYADNSFDIVVANHMLYHVPDLSQGLREVRRVLKPNGRFFAATNGNNHMKELFQFGKEMFPEKIAALNQWELRFRLENGTDLLAPTFDTVQLELFADSLDITEAAPLSAYVQSTFRMAEATPEMRASVDKFFGQKIATDKVIHISKETGLFIAF